MLTIDKMTYEDIADLLKLEQECFSVPWSEESFLYGLADDSALFLVAKMGDEVAGYIGSQNIVGEVYIDNICTTPKYRKQGIATALLDEVISYSKKCEAEFITLEVRESNTPAISLYEKFGFDKVGLRKNYYTKPTENALIMTLYFKIEGDRKC